MEPELCREDETRVRDDQLVETRVRWSGSPLSSARRIDQPTMTRASGSHRMHGWKRLGCWADVVAGADDLGLNDAASIGDLDFAETRDRNRPTFASGSTQPLFERPQRG